MPNDPTPVPPETPILTQDLTKLRARLDAIPPDRTGAIVVGVEWKGWVPTSMHFGVATRVGKHFAFGADAEKKFHAKPNADVYAALTW